MRTSVHTKAEDAMPIFFGWFVLCMCIYVVMIIYPALCCVIMSDSPHCCLLHADAWELPVYPYW